MRLKLLALACSSAFALACNGGATTNQSPTNPNATGAPAPMPAQGAGRPLPPAEVVRLEAASVEARRGAGAQGEVRLSISEGFHVNANPASEKYLIPTELEVEPAEGIEIGAPIYPESVTRQFSFADKPLAVYEGVARIGFALKIKSDARAGEQALRARVSYQACDDEKCYPPRTVETSVPVRVNGDDCAGTLRR